MPDQTQLEEEQSLQKERLSDDLRDDGDHHSKSSFWDRLGRPRYALAPMIDQSELPFRVLCRRHGCNLGVTPMFHARHFCERSYRDVNWTLREGEPEDRALLVQFAANDAQTLLHAAKHVQAQCDGVDINLGCPQKIAKRGHFGAFLLEDHALLRDLVGTARNHLDVPVTCKIRLLWSDDETVALARMLQDAGASMLTVHGRTRAQKGRDTGPADWKGIAKVKAAVSVPVLANGGMESKAQAEACMAATGCDGVMMGEAALENPAVFEGARTGDRQEELAEEYLGIVEAYPTEARNVKQHLFNMLYGHLQVHTDLRRALHLARNVDQMKQVLAELRERPRIRTETHCNKPGEYTSWYHRHRWEYWKHAQAQGKNGCKREAAVKTWSDETQGEAEAETSTADETPWMEALA